MKYKFVSYPCTYGAKKHSVAVSLSLSDKYVCLIAAVVPLSWI